MKKIKIEIIIAAPLEKIWEFWNGAEHIPHWAYASKDWAAEPISNDLREGGNFVTRMFAKDGSSSFNFGGVYTKVIPNFELDYTLDDGRTVTVDFERADDNTVKIVQEFEMENQNTEELQRSGWQAYLDNFKGYVENHS